jgi:cbb3-type cytochrome oxidase maturation protein
MSIIYVLIPLAIILTAIGIYLFFWAVKSDQFDDLEKQGMSILYDDDTKTKTSANSEKNNNSDQHGND